MNWTREELQRRKDAGMIRDFTIPEEPKKKKRAKFNNQKVEYDGHVFDSKKEYNRYRELLLLLKSGEIGQLRLQVPYLLIPANDTERKVEYIADFQYIHIKEGLTVEDVKGYATDTFKIKKKLMKSIHGIDVKIT